MNFRTIDETHDATARCWVEDADGHAEFPVQNLPLALFSDDEDGPRLGVAIANQLFDVARATEHGLFPDLEWLADVSHERLNELLALGADARRALRHALFALLTDGARAAAALPCLVPAERTQLHLPCEVGDYTDFYAGIHHANNVGRQFRPDNPLLRNYRHVPIGYHGRASTVVASGTPVIRPAGQLPSSEGPHFGKTRRLDLELELGVWIGGGNPIGEPVPIAEAADQIAGFCLLNDWSARDIQAWEYQPLGPFLAKNFLTTVSPLIVTPEALAPFRAPAMPRGADEPQPLPYLLDAQDQAHGGLSLGLGVWLQTKRMRDEGEAEVRISDSGATNLYWTVAQMVAHHTSGGCALRAGDLFGTGTISGSTAGSEGSLLELTKGGKEPITLPNGETRAFLEDGDRLSITATAARPGFAGLGFGRCTGEILA